MRDDRGQGTVEYVAVASLVAVVLGAAGALTSGGLGVAVERGIERGICAVAGERCPAYVAASLPRDLEPCPVKRTDDSQDISLDIGVVRLAARLGLSLERLSDGRVRVSFADGGRAGLGAAVGAHFTLGRVGAKAEASVDGGLALTAGRVWVLPGRAAAERFVARFGASQRLDGRARVELERICAICGVLAGAPARPPDPDERWRAGGLAAGSTLGVAAGPARAEIESLLRGAVGRRTTAAGTTWFLRLDDQVAGSLDALGGGLDGQVESHSVAALESDRQGTPKRLRITTEHRISTRKGLRLPAKLRSIVGSDATGAGRVVESESVLDLTDADDRRLALELLRAVPRLDPSGALRSGRGLAGALAERGRRTVRVYRLGRSGIKVGAGAALGVRLGVDGASRNDSQQLVSVATKLPGLGWLPRADCLAL